METKLAGAARLGLAARPAHFKQVRTLVLAVAVLVLATMAASSVSAATTTVVITGTTATAENDPGKWFFNRDASNSTEWGFTSEAHSIGSGSLLAGPIGATQAGPPLVRPKFIADFFLQEEMGDVNEISYDFKIKNTGTQGASAHLQFYMNVYVNWGTSPQLKFYDCRYDVIPTSGSTTDFTTITFDPDETYPVMTTTAAPPSGVIQPCPTKPADMGADAFIRNVTLSLGDTSDNDVGMSGYFDNVVFDIASEVTIFDFETCSTVCYADAVNGSDLNSGASPATAKKTIQAAIDAVSPGGEVRVLPGNYDEKATNRFVLGVNGPHQFGLFIDKDDISILGVDASDVAVTDAASTLARVTTNATNNFGYSGIFVQGDGVTIQGLEIGPNAPSQNKTIEVIGDDFGLLNSHIDVSEGNVYFGDWQYDDNGTDGVYGDDVAHIKTFNIAGNIFDETGISISSGAGANSPTAGRTITGNKFNLSQANPLTAISFNGYGEVAWYEFPIGAAVITGNTFTGGASHIRARSNYDNSLFDWDSYWNDNTFDRAVAFGTNPPADLGTFDLGGTYTNVRRIGGLIQPEIDSAVANPATGLTVLVNEGTYSERLTITESMHLVGEDGKAATNIVANADVTSQASTSDRNIVTVRGAGVNAEITGFTVKGPATTFCNDAFRGIRVDSGAFANIHDNSVLDIHDSTFSGCQTGLGIVVVDATADITNNVVENYQKGGIVISGASAQADIMGNTVTGIGNTSILAQNGISVQTGASATVNGNAVSGNSYFALGNPAETTVAVNLLLLNATSVQTDGNTLTDGEVGIYAISNSLNLNGDFIESSAAATAGSPTFYGMIIDPDTAGAQTLTITNATVRGSGGTIGRGITITDDAIANQIALTLTNNFVEGWGEFGVRIDDTVAAGTSYASANVSQNSITGNTEGLRRTGLGSLNVPAELNWWGAATGPNTAGADTTSGTVDFAPWLCTGTDTSPAIGFQPDLSLQCGAARKLVFSTQPPALASLLTDFSVAVQAVDDLNNVITSFTGPVTLAIGSNPGGATLSTGIQANPSSAVAGVRSFNTVSLDAPGVGYTLTASSPGLTTGTSNAFNVDGPGGAAGGPLVVNDFGDAGVGGCTLVECTLREAIIEANLNGDADIDDIQFAGPGTVVLTTPLPVITSPVNIDGTAGSTGATCVNNLTVKIDGSAIPGFAFGFVLDAGASGSAIKGLAIGNFSGAGIVITNSNTNLVTCNWIGTLDGTSAAPNDVGVFISGPSADNGVGNPGTGINVIAGNTGAGIKADGSGAGNTMSFNSFGGRAVGSGSLPNGGLGIDLAGDGVTPNDDLDLDGGPNDTQNFPVITSVGVVGGNYQVDGTLNSEPNKEFWVFAYTSSVCDPSGHGEGEVPLGQVALANTDAAGNATFSFVVPQFSGFLTLVVDDGVTTSSSEFSACATPPADADLSLVKTGPEFASRGETIVYELTVQNIGLTSKNVRLRDTIPAGTRFVKAEIVNAPGWVITAKPSPGGTGTVQFSKSIVNSGETATFKVYVKVNTTVPLGSTIINTATVMSAIAPGSTASPIQDNNLDNNTDTAETLIQ